MNSKPLKSPAYVLNLAREMRRNPTTAEELLWQKLRRNALDGFKFYRQYTIDRFITDFCCPEKKLVIELDGEIHTNRKEAFTIRKEAVYLLDWAIKLSDLKMSKCRMI